MAHDAPAPRGARATATVDGGGVRASTTTATAALTPPPRSAPPSRGASGSRPRASAARSRLPPAARRSGGAAVARAPGERRPARCAGRRPTRARARARRARRGVPSKATAPSCRHTTRPHSAATSSVWCVESTTRASPTRGDELAEAQPLLRVEPGGRLVEHEQLRAAEQRLRQRDAPAHAARQRPDALVGDVVEADRAQHAPHLGVALAAVGPLLEGRDVVDELERREVRVEPGLLRQVAEPAADLGRCARVARVAPEQAQLAAAGRSTVASIRISVVLPAPFGPSRPVMPVPMSSVTPASATLRP